MDVLQSLRDFYVADQLDQVVEEGDAIDFGGARSFDRGALTTYKSNQGEGRFYELQTLLDYARSAKQGVKYKEYYRAALQAKRPRVGPVDHKDVLSYLSGAVDTNPYIHLVLPADVLAAAGQAAGGAAAETEEQAALRAVQANERQLRDRNTMLSLPNRSFRGVLDVLDGVLATQEAQQERARAADRAAREAEAAAARKRAKQAAAAVVGARPSGRYQRETATDAALKQIGAQNLGLQQVGFGASPEAAPPAAAAPLPPPPPPPPPPDQPGASQPAPPPRERERRPAAPPSKSPRAAAPAGGKPRRQGTPIIIVPPAATALLNIFNAPDFFARGKLQTPEEAQAAGAARPAPNDRASYSYVAIQRTEGRPGEGVRYHITDQEPKNKADWGRVAAVVTLGKPWQFKGWPFKGASSGDLVDTFQRVCGLHLHFSDTPPEGVVKGWNVKMVPVSRHAREQDRQVARECWKHLDAFLKGRNSSLAY